MGALWSLATLGCAIAANYEQMMLARFFIGLGEAAYGSVGLAVVLMVFAPAKRASLTGAFMAGGSFGSVLGVFLGGILAVQLGWRWSFGVMAILGLVLVGLYGCSSTTASSPQPAPRQHPSRARLATRRSARSRTLVSTPPPSSARTSAAACSCSSPARSSPGCPTTSAALTTLRRTRPASALPGSSCSWAPA